MRVWEYGRLYVARASKHGVWTYSAYFVEAGAEPYYFYDKVNDLDDQPGQIEILNSIGLDGWELVSVTLQNASYQESGTNTPYESWRLKEHTFKREVQKAD